MNIKKIIINTTNTLLKDKSFDDISVALIAKTAGISRQTFYNHYLDKYDLVNSFYESYIRDHIIINYNGDNYLETSRQIYAFIYEYRYFFNKAIDFTGQNAFSKHITGFIEESILMNYRRQFGDHAVTGKTMFQLHSIAIMEVECIRQWLKSGCSIPIDDVTRWTAEITPDMFK